MMKNNAILAYDCMTCRKLSFIVVKSVDNCGRCMHNIDCLAYSEPFCTNICPKCWEKFLWHRVDLGKLSRSIESGSLTED